MIHEAFHNTTLPTNSSKVRHPRNTETQENTKYTYPGYLGKIGRLGIHYRNVSPVMDCAQQVELTL